ncbi:MAG: type ISP restriction/modification enzyme [Planctomycetota bacterium]|nr:type ISP restriction/modification enzyme [Planctomycetota bacterium]
MPDLKQAIAKFGAEAKAKLANPSATGEPEDQLRAPLEGLFADLAEICGFKREWFTAVGESSLTTLKTRPDYAISLRKVLVGYVEVKAPGKGADPRRYKGHDKEQWEKLQTLPNLLYTDGNSFSVWQNGELVGSIVDLDGDIEKSGAKLEAPIELVARFDNFLRWEPIPPKTAVELAKVAARLCRLLRDEVTEQLAEKSRALTALAADWRKLLFPEANDEQFADGYAQAVTFGLLMARSSNIRLADGLDQVGKQLGKTNSLIGAALRLLTDEVDDEAALKTSLGALVRVLDAVNWQTISKGQPDAWLYFYEDFLAVYDNALRKRTGSYYTPPEVVEPMIRLVDDVLRRHFGRTAGLASTDVTLADPAVGTGTFILGVLRRIAADVEAEQGAGAVPQAIESAIGRLIAFEMQLGPFAVAQLRVFAELLQLVGKTQRAVPRMFVTDTLDNPFAEIEELGSLYRTISESRLKANEIKSKEPITVVIGNPPYKEKANGRGGWVEDEQLSSWIPPADWGVGAHAKHLRNLYIYFWRWATWKVFDRDPEHDTGIVCFITVAGFLNGPGFQKMRDYLRRTADRIWIIDCTPEGHQPDVPTRIFQGVQQPVCIVLVARSKKKSGDKPAKVRYTALPVGKREEKFAALAKLKIESKAWKECSTDWRAPFLPAVTGDWATYPSLDVLFAYNGSGVQPMRVWVIAPDADSLKKRWQVLVKEKSPAAKMNLFHPTLRGGKPSDRHIDSVVQYGLAGNDPRTVPLSRETRECLPPIMYGHRSFDRQWIIPDPRVITQPNLALWESGANKQVFLTALMAHSPSSGPAITFTALPPDKHHYKGSFSGRAFPLWRDAEATEPNLPPNLLESLATTYKIVVTAEDVMAYLAAVAANPAYTARFKADLAQPGLRIPLTEEPKLFTKAVELGRRVIWLHTFGERFAEKKANRPAGPPRLPKDRAPRIPKNGAIPDTSADMPDEILYDEGRQRLLVGKGFIDNVIPAVWQYEVSGKRVLTQWFSYRKKNRERPIIGDRRPPSKLGDIQPDAWLAEYTTELLNVLHVLTMLVEMEPEQSQLLEAICEAQTINYIPGTSSRGGTGLSS